MSIYFSGKFKSLRKNSDLTQDQVAEIFRVSPQSVSRWETGANYPDIELLPHIAAFFKVTVDELLGTETILSEQKIYNYTRDIRNLLNTGNVPSAISTARTAVKEFPVNYDLQNLLLQSLCADGSDALKNEIIATGERIINYSSDQNVSLPAKYQLINRYVKWEMREEAKKIVDTLPSEAYFTQDLMLGRVLTGDEWTQNQKLRITRFKIMLCDLIGEYAVKADLDALKRIECFQTAWQIDVLARAATDNVLIGDEHTEAAFHNVVLAEFYCEAGDTENALSCVEEATREAMYQPDMMVLTNEDGSNYFASSTPRNLCWILWEDHLVKPQFDVIRDDVRFVTCFEMLKTHSHEMG
ncbi:MAG: helix-turn-helix domain-containing protein [Oscillospiraceae bacterium]|jgi:transcriptional regulator with XRE-family HTH domain|nr:helix-turn-helix domain-containing protein [Oscillospiraceae bacterium]